MECFVKLSIHTYTQPGRLCSVPSSKDSLAAPPTSELLLTALMSPADQTHVHKLEKYQHLRNMYTFDKYAALPAIWRLPESD